MKKKRDEHIEQLGPIRKATPTEEKKLMAEFLNAGKKRKPAKTVKPRIPSP